jgi:protein-L-isoaspartate(D-aspartate) O-methyltransferase
VNAPSFQDPFEEARRAMVASQLAGRDIRDARVLEAFRRVPRHLFVPPGEEGRAYEDRPVGIGYGQTISQPYMVAFMTQALDLRGGEKVLEIGAGSGYQTAILLALGARVWSVERIPELADFARRNLERAGFREARLRVADGTLGWPEEAPFDRVLVAAGAPSLPVALVEQLREGGRLVIPIGSPEEQDLYLVTREGGRVERRKLCACVFVKLVGREGW